MNWRKKSKNDWGRLDLILNKEIKYSKIIDSLYIKGRIGWKGLKKEEYLPNSDFRIINGKSVKEGGIDWGETGYITKERYDESPEIMLKSSDIVITKDGTIGKVALIDELTKPTTVASGLFVVRNINPEKWDTKFLYYYLISPFFKSFIESRTEGSVIPHLYQRDFEQLELPEFSLKEQRAVSNLLSALDNRIAENKKINHHLAEMAESIWKEKYANLKPNSTLGNFFPIITGKKDANVARGGQYPFFSCSQGISYTDAYSFEGNAILLAGNGDFNVKTYNGKFEAYQRTYVLIPNNEYRLGFLYYAIKHFLSDITAGDRGSVIKYITKGDIENLNLYMPDDESDFELFNQFVSNTAQNNAEIERLTETRDTLLPKLMSGELSVID